MSSSSSSSSSSNVHQHTFKYVSEVLALIPEEVREESKKPSSKKRPRIYRKRPYGYRKRLRGYKKKKPAKNTQTSSELLESSVSEEPKIPRSKKRSRSSKKKRTSTKRRRQQEEEDVENAQRWQAMPDLLFEVNALTMAFYFREWLKLPALPASKVITPVPAIDEYFKLLASTRRLDNGTEIWTRDEFMAWKDARPKFCAAYAKFLPTILTESVSTLKDFNLPEPTLKDFNLPEEATEELRSRVGNSAWKAFGAHMLKWMLEQLENEKVKKAEQLEIEKAKRTRIREVMSLPDLDDTMTGAAMETCVAKLWSLNHHPDGTLVLSAEQVKFWIDRRPKIKELYEIYYPREAAEEEKSEAKVGNPDKKDALYTKSERLTLTLSTLCDDDQNDEEEDASEDDDEDDPEDDSEEKQKLMDFPDIPTTSDAEMGTYYQDLQPLLYHPNGQYKLGGQELEAWFRLRPNFEWLSEVDTTLTMAEVSKELFSRGKRQEKDLLSLPDIPTTSMEEMDAYVKMLKPMLQHPNGGCKLDEDQMEAWLKQRPNFGWFMSVRSSLTGREIADELMSRGKLQEEEQEQGQGQGQEKDSATYHPDFIQHLKTLQLTDLLKTDDIATQEKGPALEAYGFRWRNLMELPDGSETMNDERFHEWLEARPNFKEIFQSLHCPSKFPSDFIEALRTLQIADLTMMDDIVVQRKGPALDAYFHRLVRLTRLPNGTSTLSAEQWKEWLEARPNLNATYASFGLPSIVEEEEEEETE